MKHLQLFLIAFVYLIAISCEKDKESNPLEFNFTLLDTLGNAKTIFNQDENFIFSFFIVNKSSDTVYFNNFMPNNDLFRVYSINSSNETADKGIPYNGYPKIGGYNILPNDTLYFISPWLAEKVTYLLSINVNGVGEPVNFTELESGQYATSFSQVFKYSVRNKQIETEEYSFRINFEIKLK